MISLRALGESSVLALQGWVGEKSSQIDGTRSERKGSTVWEKGTSELGRSIVSGEASRCAFVSHPY
jgi:hypothetical protein